MFCGGIIAPMSVPSFRTGMNPLKLGSVYAAMFFRLIGGVIVPYQHSEEGESGANIEGDTPPEMNHSPGYENRCEGAADTKATYLRTTCEATLANGGPRGNDSHDIGGNRSLSNAG